jgi:hypothetical protein
MRLAVDLFSNTVDARLPVKLRVASKDAKRTLDTPFPHMYYILLVPPSLVGMVHSHGVVIVVSAIND